MRYGEKNFLKKVPKIPNIQELLLGSSLDQKMKGDDQGQVEHTVKNLEIQKCAKKNT